MDLGLSDKQKQDIEARIKLSYAQLRSAAVLIPLQARQNDWEIILTQRSDVLKHHPGQISFPGGSREPQDPDLSHTALRESQEEISLRPTQVEVVGYLPDYPTITGFRVTPVVGLVEESASVEADQVEVTRIHRLPVPVLLEEGRLKRHMMQREGIEVPIFEIGHSDFVVWGATAGMLYTLKNILKEINITI